VSEDCDAAPPTVTVIGNCAIGEPVSSSACTVRLADCPTVPAVTSEVSASEYSGRMLSASDNAPPVPLR
jgi:hypothetical protein